MSDEENDAKVAALEKKLAENDAKGELAGKVFNPKALFERTQRLKEINDPVLGLIKYGELTLEDSFVFAPIQDPNERTLTVAYLMLKKAYPNVTLDMVRKMPLAEANAFMAIVAAQSCFLPQTSANGSATTVKRRK